MQDDQNWLSDFLSGIKAFRAPHLALTAPPAGASLSDLVAARAALAVDDRHSRPGLAAGQQFASAVCGMSARDRMTDVVAGAVGAIDVQLASAIASLPAKEIHDAGILRTADFGSAIVPLESPSGVTFAGPLDALGAGHPLWSLLPPDDCYQITLVGQQAGPALILGPGNPVLAGPISPRVWYTLSAVLELTRAWRAGQRRQEQERADHRRRQELIDKQAREQWESETAEGQIATLRRRLAQLENRRG